MERHIGNKKADLDWNDFSFVAFTPLLLAAVYFIPLQVKEKLVFSYTNPGLIQAYTAHFVHIKPWHFLGNLGIAAITLSILYMTFSFMGKKREFRRLYAAILLGFPWIITAIDYFLMNAINSGLDRVMGFSAINMALIGVIPLAVFEYFHESTEGRFHRSNAVYFFFFGISIVLLSLLRLFGRYGISVSSELFYGIALFMLAVIAYADYRLLQAIEEADLSVRGIFNSIESRWHAWIIIVILLYFFGSGLAVPSKLIHNGGFVNFIAHVIGFVLGFYIGEVFLWSKVESGLIPRKE